MKKMKKMKKISIALCLFVGVAFLATFVSSAFTLKKEVPLFIAPSIQAVDFFAGDPVEVFGLVQDNAQNIDQFKSAGQRVSGVNMVGATVSNGRISKRDFNKDDASAHFEYEAQTGSLSFSKGIMEQMNVSKPKQLPSEDQAKELSNQFLASSNLAPKQKEQLELVHVGGLKMATKEATVDMMKMVHYGRKINGVPVSGPGSKLTVSLGNNGQVLAVSRKWRDVSPSASGGVGKAPELDLKTQEEAEKEFAVLVNQLFGNVQYKLVSVQKLYFDNDGKYVQPVFLIQADIANGQGQNVPLIQPISMLKNAPEKIGFDAQQIKAEAAKAGDLSPKARTQDNTLPSRN
jgi:hypothetical protein